MSLIMLVSVGLYGVNLSAYFVMCLHLSAFRSSGWISVLAVCVLREGCRG